MYSTLLTVALFIAPLIQGALADFAINSPDLVQVTFYPTNYSLSPSNSQPFLFTLVQIQQDLMVAYHRPL
jgi:hypothetical protein